MAAKIFVGLYRLHQRHAAECGARPAARRAKPCRLPAPRCRRHRSWSRYASSWAERYRILDQSWPARLRRRSNPSAKRGIEEHHGLGGQRAVLGGAERQHVHARLPAQRGRRCSPGCSSALANRAPSMCSFRPWRRQAADRAAISRRRVHRAPFGGLGNANRFRQHEMYAAIDGAGHDRVDLRRPDLAVRARQRHQLGAAHVEFGRAAFVRRDVGFLVTNHRAVGPNERGQGQARWRRCRWPPGRPVTSRPNTSFIRARTRAVIGSAP